MHFHGREQGLQTPEIAANTLYNFPGAGNLLKNQYAQVD
jgi:hypothetical protein